MAINALTLSRKTKAEKQRLVERLWAREVARCAESFEYFFFKHVRTTDPHDHEHPVKSVPEKDYLRYVANDLQHGPERRYYAKSRQLMISWELCARAVWEILYHPHAWACFQSKKLEDAAEMIYDSVPSKARASFIMANLHPKMQVCIADVNGERKAIPYTLDQRTFSYGSITLPNGARCNALAQGAAQIEGKVPSLFISDESSLQEEWATSWAAAMPCSQRAIAVATMRLPSAYGEEIATCDEVDPDGLMRGVAEFTTASGGAGLRIHYSADPDKDPKTPQGRDWFAKETANMRGGYEGPDWQAHMEINPASVTGQRCIPYWHKIVDRVVIDDIAYEQAALWKLGAGADYGSRNPTVLLIFAIDYHGNFYAVDEIAAPGLTVHELPGITKGGVAGLSQLWKQNPLLPRINGQIQMDPTVDAKTQNTEGGLTSILQMFSMNGIFLQLASARGTDADDLALNWLAERWAGHEEPDWAPQFFICRRCKGLLRILAKCEYLDWSATVQHKNNLQQKMKPGTDVDYFDGFKYWVCSLPQGPVRLKAAPPMGSFPWLRNLVLKETRKYANARS